MRILIICVGRMKQGAERELADRYRERFADAARKLGLRAIDIVELNESRARDTATRMTEEAAAIAQAIPDGAVIITLDERGKSLASATFADQVARWRDGGAAAVVFVIGGADGLSPELQRKASLSLAFGAATWPHQMVRVMLLEQLYRVATILTGHPYHRA